MKPASSASRWAGLSTVTAAAVGTPAAAMTSLAKALEPSIRAAAGGRPEADDPGGPHGVGDPGDQRHLGPDHDEVGLPAPSPRPATACGSTQVEPVLLGDRGGAGVAGGAGQRGDGGVLRQGEDMSVLTSTGADDQDAHGQPA